MHCGRGTGIPGGLWEAGHHTQPQLSGPQSPFLANGLRWHQSAAVLQPSDPPQHRAMSLGQRRSSLSLEMPGPPEVGARGSWNEEEEEEEAVGSLHTLSVTGWAFQDKLTLASLVSREQILTQDREVRGRYSDHTRRLGRCGFQPWIWPGILKSQYFFEAWQ